LAKAKYCWRSLPEIIKSNISKNISPSGLTQYLNCYTLQNPEKIDMNIKLTLGIIAFTLLGLITPAILKAQILNYGTTRRPHTCPPSGNSQKKRSLNVEQAKMYFTCDNERQDGTPGQRDGGFSSSLNLINDLTLQIAPRSRPSNSTDLKFNNHYGGETLGMDTEQRVYDIRGSYTRYICRDSKTYPERYPVGKNCDVERFTSAGICFLDTFGEWHCRMIGSATRIGYKLPPPEKWSSPQ
jgi:hypothetical protein